VKMSANKLQRTDYVRVVGEPGYSNVKRQETSTGQWSHDPTSFEGMCRMRRMLTLLLSAIIATVAFAVPVGAEPPLQQASGEGIFTGLEVLSTRFAGPNRIEVRRITGDVTGDLEGTWTQEVRGVIHPNGEVTFQGTWEFTGVVGSCGTGTVSGSVTGKGLAGQFPVTTAHARITNQPSNSLPVVGQGTLNQQGPFVTYDLQYRCR
jgi:hypothetical protein